MRVTNSSSQRAILNSIQKSYALLTKYQNQMANGKRINVASDDPVGLYRVLTFNTEISKLDQYVENIDYGLDEMKATETVFTNVLDRLLKVKEIVVSASNEIQRQETLDTYAAQVEEILKEIVDQSNFVVNDKYIFSGYATDSAAFTATYVGNYINAVTYNGDTGQRVVEINSGMSKTINYVGDNTADPTVPGVFVDVNAPAKNIFTSLIQFRTDLLAGNVANIMSTDSVNLSQYTSYLETLLGQLGVRIQEMTNVSDAHNSNSLFKTQLRSDIEDIDAAEAASNMSNQQVAFQAAIQVGAQIVQQSIFDYLN